MLWRPSGRRMILAPMLGQGQQVPPVPERRSFLKKMLAGTAGAAALLGLKPREARADNDPWISEIAIVPFNFAPVGWALCDGSLLAIATNTALFSLLGTTYGGNGTTNFALPDLRGRVPLMMGQGPGLSVYTIGQIGGAEVITLTAAQMPQHNHVMGVVGANGNTNSPVNAVPAVQASGVPTYSSATVTGGMSATALSYAGSSQPHENHQPFLTLNFIIAMQGIFPSRP